MGKFDIGSKRSTQLLFGFAFGLIVAVLAYRWITDPAPRMERRLQESVVVAARAKLGQALAIGPLEIVDPLAPNRKVGKSYIYRTDEGWQVSGYYRRGEQDRWHPYLLSLGPAMTRTSLKVQDGDAGLAERAAADPTFEIVE
jgi:hypothetical protein